MRHTRLLFRLLVLAGLVLFLEAFQSVPALFPFQDRHTRSSPCKLILFVTKDHKVDSDELSNLTWLQKKYNLTDEWREKCDRSRTTTLVDSINRSSLLDRLGTLQEKFSLSDQEVGIVVQRDVQFLRNSATKTAETAEFFRERFQFDDAALKQILIKETRILGRNTTALAEELGIFQERLALDKQDLKQLIMKDPRFLKFNFANSLDARLEMLQDYLQLTESEVIQFCLRYPHLLLASFENIESAFEWLGDDLRLSHSQRAMVFRRFPALAQANADNSLRPTMKFLKSYFGEEKAIEMLTNDLRRIAVSLEKRLKPRLAQAEQLGIAVDDSILGNLVRLPQKKWDDYLAVRVEGSENGRYGDAASIARSPDWGKRWKKRKKRNEGKLE